MSFNTNLQNHVIRLYNSIRDAESVDDMHSIIDSVSRFDISAIRDGYRFTDSDIVFQVFDLSK